MPVCFGISFTNTILNQAGALVHVYTDGSVSVSTGAVEMGQGVNAKLLAVASRTLGVEPRQGPGREHHHRPGRQHLADRGLHRRRHERQGHRARLHDHPRPAPRGGGRPARLSMPSEVTFAADRVLVRGEESGAHLGRAGVAGLHPPGQPLRPRPLRHPRASTSTASAGKGEPFAYHVFGTAVVEVTLDCLRGTYTRRPGADRPRRRPQPRPAGGPRPGRGRRGPGPRLDDLEELLCDRGRLLTDTLTTYKVPDIHTAPGDRGRLPRRRRQPRGRAPLQGGRRAARSCTASAPTSPLLDALKAARPEGALFFDSPLTPEKALMFLEDAHG